MGWFSGFKGFVAPFVPSAPKSVWDVVVPVKTPSYAVPGAIQSTPLGEALTGNKVDGTPGSELPGTRVKSEADLAEEKKQREIQDYQNRKRNLLSLQMEAPGREATLLGAPNRKGGIPVTGTGSILTGF